MRPLVRPVSVDRIRPLRRDVLRPGLTPSESEYVQDDAPTTVHLAALAHGAVIGCATVFPEPLDEQPAWRLRGMAVAQPHRGTGVGSELLQEVIVQVANSGGRVLWCNARTVALPFYQRHGFVVIGDEFLAAHGIPHHQMWRPVAASLLQR